TYRSSKNCPRPLFTSKPPRPFARVEQLPQLTAARAVAPVAQARVGRFVRERRRRAAERPGAQAKLRRPRSARFEERLPQALAQVVARAAGDAELALAEPTGVAVNQVADAVGRPIVRPGLERHRQPFQPGEEGQRLR